MSWSTMLVRRADLDAHANAGEGICAAFFLHVLTHSDSTRSGLLIMHPHLSKVAMLRVHVQGR